MKKLSFLNDEKLILKLFREWKNLNAHFAEYIFQENKWSMQGSSSVITFMGDLKPYKNPLNTLESEILRTKMSEKMWMLNLLSHLRKLVLTK